MTLYPQHRTSTCANPDPQFKTEVAIPRQKNISGDPKFIYILFPLSGIVFHLVLVHCISETLNTMIFVIYLHFSHYYSGRTSLLWTATSYLQHEIKTLKIFLKISEDFFLKESSWAHFWNANKAPRALIYFGKHLLIICWSQAPCKVLWN